MEINIGEKFGKLTVLDLDYKKIEEYKKEKNRKVIFVKCKCDCGVIKPIRYADLKYGKIKSCGCLKIKLNSTNNDIINNKYGKLTVMKYSHREKKKGNKIGYRHYYYCNCECGNTNILAERNNLKFGDTKSCGCLNTEHLDNCYKKQIDDENTLYNKGKNFLVEWDYSKNKIDPKEVGYKSSKKVWWICSNNHSYQQRISDKTKGCGCPYCAGNRTLFSLNDIYTKNPELIKYFQNMEDSKKYSKCSGKILELKCPVCNFNKKIKISTLYKQGFSCPKCGDGKSYSEKFIFKFLEQLNLKFECQKTFKWSERKIYDFYINKFNIIIETNGIQHYEQTHNRGWKSLEEEIKNDLFKKNNAIKNKISLYISLDCRISNKDYIIESIKNSELKDLFDISKIDWDLCNTFALGSLILDIVKLYKDGLSNSKISKILKININTVKKYLVIGNEIGICNYKSAKRNKKIICIQSGEIFDSITECSKSINISYNITRYSIIKGYLINNKKYEYFY